MNKKQWMIPLSAVMIFGLVGCAANNNRAGVNEKNVNNPIRPVGYYSNENHPNNGFGFTDNDGPLTEMMDHTLGTEGYTQKQQEQRMLQTRDQNGNPINPTVPLANHDHNFFQRDNRFSTSDVNYHGQLNQNIGNQGYYTDRVTLKKISDKIKHKAETVKNVQDVKSVIYGNSVLISIDLVDNSRAKETQQAVEKAVKPYVHGKSVTVITDEGTFSRDRSGHLPKGKLKP